MRFFSSSYVYDDPWPIVSLAFFLRYPNPHAAHIISCDVIARSTTPAGTLQTTRLILKRGALPRWAPRGMVSRAESWVIEESEVDPFGRTLRCTARNVDNVKIMKIVESVHLQDAPHHKTLQNTEASIVSAFGWGLTNRIENHGFTKFKANVQRSRDGISTVLQWLRQSRLQAMGLGDAGAVVDSVPIEFTRAARDASISPSASSAAPQQGGSPWSYAKNWVRW